jgi:hypothetical protein
MGNKSDEIDRLTRLRDEQLRARDPHAKGREFERRNVVRRRLRAEQRITFIDMLKDFPYKWRGTIVGALIGLAILLVLPPVIETISPATVEVIWLQLVGLAAVIVLAIVGFILGSSFDWRDELRDF